MTSQARFFSTLQKVGQSLMVPVSVLPAAGLLVALGRLLQGSEPGSIALFVGQVCYSGGLAIFEQLPVVFAVGVAIGFTGGAGIAGLAAVVGYFTMQNVIKVAGEFRGLELAINTGVFGGIIIGLLVAQLHRRFHQIKLPQVFGFFSGKRFVPIVAAASALMVGFLFSFFWPPIQSAINSFGTYIMGSDWGPAFYAAGKRLLIPVGLHHVYYPPFLYQFGEYVTAAGKVLHGESARYFGGDPTAGRFMASEFPLMLFGLPAAAFAMYLRSTPQQRKAVGGVMLSAALTSIITGITEPIEFAFIFVAPLLYIFHVGSAFMVGLATNAMDIHLGYTFSASLIDFFLGYFNQKNAWALWTVVGPLTALWYFGAFYFAIGFFDFKTPGRDVSDLNGTDSATDNTRGNGVTATERSRQILSALGGAANIVHLDACITRLRTSVVDGSKVNLAALKSLGAAGTLNAGNGNFQVIFGVESDHIKEEIKALMETPTLNLLAVTDGKVVSLSQVPDTTFSQKVLGDGYAIQPSLGEIRAPVDGRVATVFRTGHAVGLQTNAGQEVLIHVGIDTVKMNGDGFSTLVKEGQYVKAGDLLLTFDLQKVRTQATSTLTPVVVTNLELNATVQVSDGKMCRAGDVAAVVSGDWSKDLLPQAPERTATL
jgi:glucose PTS system EIICBA or EIICB component